MSKSIVESKGLEVSAKDNSHYQKSLSDRIMDLKYQNDIARLTGHAYECEIQVNPNWKPCTCGRG